MYSNYWLLLGIGYMIGLFIISRSRSDFWHPINFVFYVFFIQYLLPAALLSIEPSSSFGKRWGIETKIIAYAPWAIWMTNLFLSFFVIGFTFKIRLPLWLTQLRLDRDSLEKASWVTALIYIFTLGSFFLFQNGVYQLFSKFKIQSGSGWVNLIIILLSFSAPMIFWARGWRIIGVVASLFSAIFLMLSGGRAGAVMAIFWFLLYIYYADGKKWINYLVLGMPIILVLAVQMVLAPYMTDAWDFTSAFNYQWRYLFMTEVGRLEQLAVFIWYSLANQQFDLGLNWFVSIFGPFDKMFMNYNDYRNVISAKIFGFDPRFFRAGMGGSGIADCWMVAGLPGVIVIPYFLGVAWRAAYGWMQDSKSVFACLLYVHVSAFGFQVCQEMVTFGMLYNVILPLILIVLVMKIFSRTQLEAA